jgi:hypothetical protein
LGLSEAGLVTVTRQGNQKHFQANAAAQVFSELRGLVLKTMGLADVLKIALEPLFSQIELAFVYGSVQNMTHWKRGATSCPIHLTTSAGPARHLINHPNLTPHRRPARHAGDRGHGAHYSFYRSVAQQRHIASASPAASTPGWQRSVKYVAPIQGTSNQRFCDQLVEGPK